MEDFLHFFFFFGGLGWRIILLGVLYYHLYYFFAPQKNSWQCLWIPLYFAAKKYNLTKAAKFLPFKKNYPPLHQPLLLEDVLVLYGSWSVRCKRKD